MTTQMTTPNATETVRLAGPRRTIRSAISLAALRKVFAVTTLIKFAFWLVVSWLVVACAMAAAHVDLRHETGLRIVSFLAAVAVAVYFTRSKSADQG